MSTHSAVTRRAPGVPGSGFPTTPGRHSQQYVVCYSAAADRKASRPASLPNNRAAVRSTRPARRRARASVAVVTPENELSNPILERIEKQLQLMNTHLAEANDIAMLSAFTAMPADLENESRAALRLLRDRMMTRARNRSTE
jgi:hypothetical protein